MTVVTDTSPLNYLILIDEVNLLPVLFERVVLPEAVFTELQHARTPIWVRDWLAHAPPWLEIKRVSPLTAVTSLMQLDPGEQEAIQLALQLRLGTVLMDEAEGRRAAKMLNLGVCGTLGVLERASRIGKADLREALRKLEQTSFRMSRAVREAILARNP